MIWHRSILNIYRTWQRRKAEKERMELECMLTYIDQLIEELNEKSQYSSIKS